MQGLNFRLFEALPKNRCLFSPAGWVFGGFGSLQLVFMEFNLPDKQAEEFEENLPLGVSGDFKFISFSLRELEGNLKYTGKGCPGTPEKEKSCTLFFC